MLPPDRNDNMDPGHEQDQEAAIQSPEHEADLDMAGQDDEVQDHDEIAMDGAQIEQVDVTHAQIDEDLAHNQEDMGSLHDDQDQAEYEETNVDGIPIEPRAAREMQTDEEYDEEEDTEFMQDGQDQQYDETNSDELPVESEAAPDAQIDDHDQEDTEPISDIPDQSREDLRPQTNEPHDYVEAEAEAQADESNFQSAYVSEESDPSAAADAQIFQDEPAGGHQFREDSSSLFVPEDSPPPPAPRAPLRQKPSNMPPPACPVAHPSNAASSLFSKIRNMQKANVDRKVAAQKRASTPRYNAELDNEAYLEAVMTPITPSSSTPVPTVSEDVMEDRRASAEFQRQKKFYMDLKRKNGTLTFRQDVEWMKIKGAEDARKNKQARDQAKARQETEGDTELFPEVNPTFEEDQEDGEHEPEDLFNFEPSGSRKRRCQEMPRKEPKQMSMQEAELQSMKVALEAHEDVPRKKKKKTQATDDDSQDTRASSSKGKGKGPKPKAKTTRSKAAPKKASGPKKTAKGRREADHALRQATSLFNSNVFEQQAGEDEREQPTFMSRNKQSALKELIASVPIEDKKQARSDMAVLLAATKEFDGHGSVKAAGGNWLVKGMKTSLKGYQVLGSAFMRKRENATQEPLGGLMADQMGLVSPSYLRFPFLYTLLFVNLH
jgi:hypothetical protein